MSQRIPCAFRVLEGSVIALFPTIHENDGMISSYMHVGQHSAASPDLITQLPKATQDQARELRKELESKPYNYRLKYLD